MSTVAIIFIYIFLALFSTVAGSITGMGGGVIMKPVMDLIGNYDAATIGILSSITVFVMSVVACLRQAGKGLAIKPFNLVLLAAGSVGGGYAGQALFDLISANANDRMIKIVQNSILAVLIVGIFFYMLFKDKIVSFHLKNFSFFLLVGAFLGIISSFLGIGGGPINVAILIFLFSLDVKTATFASIITILAAQLSKLATVLFTTGFGGFDLTVLPYMAVSAVVGALIGSFIKKKVSEKVIVICFNAIQVLIAGICILNIIMQVIG